MIITIFGGGSYFVPSFVGTMCRLAQVFAGTEVRLHDVNSERTNLVRRFCTRFAAGMNVPMTFVEEPRLDRALDGADYVIVTCRVGGPQALEMDESLPQQYGYLGNETVGPGGLFMAVRTVPVLLDIARRMQKLCPKAWLLNYANPTNFLTDALHRSGFTRSMGLCDGFICPCRDLSVMVNIPFEEIYTMHAGINHCAWCYSARRGRTDVLALLRRMSDAEVEKNVSAALAHKPEGIPRRMGWLRLFRLFDRFPAPAGHLDAYFYHDEQLAKQLQSDPKRATWDNARTHAWDLLKAQIDNFNLAEAMKVTKAHEGGHADLAIGVTAALASNSGAVFPVNIPQKKIVDGFSADTVLELYSKITRTGPQPLPVPAFPAPILAQQQHLANFQKLTVTGILEKDKRKLLQALTVHPFTRSVDTARRCFDDMWEAEKNLHGPYWAKVR